MRERGRGRLSEFEWAALIRLMRGEGGGLIRGLLRYLLDIRRLICDEELILFVLSYLAKL